MLQFCFFEHEGNCPSPIHFYPLITVRQGCVCAYSRYEMVYAFLLCVERKERDRKEGHELMR